MTPAPEDFGRRFASELARLSDGRISAAQATALGAMSREDVVRRVATSLRWLDAASVELLASRGPEDFARGIVREQIREKGEPKGVVDRMWWLQGLLDFLTLGHL